MKKYFLLILLVTNLAFAFSQKGIAVIVDDVNSKKTSELIDKTDENKWRLNCDIRAAIDDGDNIIVVKDDSDTSAVTLIRIKDGKIIKKDSLPEFISKYGLAATDKKELILSAKRRINLLCKPHSRRTFWSKCEQ